MWVRFTSLILFYFITYTNISQPLNTYVLWVPHETHALLKVWKAFKIYNCVMYYHKWQVILLIFSQILAIPHVNCFPTKLSYLVLSLNKISILCIKFFCKLKYCVLLYCCNKFFHNFIKWETTTRVLHS